MARIEGIRIKNYRVLKDITLGKLWHTPDAQPLTPMTAVIGKNGVGKSSLFDAFGFLSDCLKLGVEEACDARGRGGFGRIRSQASEEPIQFEINYRGESSAPPITYTLTIDLDKEGRPFVVSELSYQLYVEQRDDQALFFLINIVGNCFAWRGETQGLHVNRDGYDLEKLKQLSAGEESPGIEFIELDDKRKLGIATIGALKQHPRIAAFRQYLEGWYLSYFTPDAARSLPLAGPQRRLNAHGDNLGNVVQYMEREHPDRFKRILARIAERVPGINRIDTEISPDGRLLLRFNDQGFTDPFYAQQMSGGTLKVFAYLLMLEDPEPPPFICIEEPENGLYHKLLEVLAAEFRRHATGESNTSQIFVTTHQPYFVDALNRRKPGCWRKGRTASPPFAAPATIQSSKPWLTKDCRLAVSGTVTILSGARPMHFEVLAEDPSGSIAVTSILEKILGADSSVHSWRVHDYKGSGRIPKGLQGTTDPQKRVLLDRLPKVLRGYGQSLPDSAAVIVVVDLDDRDCMAFKQELLDVLAACNPRPRTLFRIAIEESEAWLLGDRKAIKTAYPHAKDSVLSNYAQDSICGTWEVLADAVNSWRFCAI